MVRVKVEGGGEQVVAHVGLHALGAFADRLGVGDSLSQRIPITGERLPLHDRGKVLVQAMLMLAGGGEACSDIEHLRWLCCVVRSGDSVKPPVGWVDQITRAGSAKAAATRRLAVTSTPSS